MQAIFVTDGIVARTTVRNSGGEQQIDKGVQPTAGLDALTNTSGALSPNLYVMSPRVVDMCTTSRVAQGPYRALRRNTKSRDFELSFRQNLPLETLRFLLLGTFPTCALRQKHSDLQLLKIYVQIDIPWTYNLCCILNANKTRWVLKPSKNLPPNGGSYTTTHIKVESF